MLRRLQTTPIGPVRVLAAQLAADLTVAVVMVVLILAVARIGFAVPLPRQAGGFILAALLAAAALLGAGLLVAAIAPTGRVARGIGALLFYPMMFFAGLWLPIPSMPAVLQHISHATPLGAAVPALTAAAEGSMPTALQLRDHGRVGGGVRTGGSQILPLGVDFNVEAADDQSHAAAARPPHARRA